MPEGSIYHQTAEQLAESMIQIYGAAAPSKAIDMIRINTGAGNRDAAVKWHCVMSLIEEARRMAR
jgi:hypothetical protein